MQVKYWAQNGLIREKNECVEAIGGPYERANQMKGYEKLYRSTLTCKPNKKQKFI